MTEGRYLEGAIADAPGVPTSATHGDRVRYRDPLSGETLAVPRRQRE